MEGLLVSRDKCKIVGGIAAIDPKGENQISIYEAFVSQKLS